MPFQQPDRSSVYVDEALQNVSVAFQQDQRDYVASLVFPTIPVDHDTGKYFVYDRAFWFRNQMKKRAMSTESAGGGFEIGTQSFECENYGLHKDIDDRLVGNASPIIKLRQDATQWLTGQGLLNLEIVWANAFFKTGVWTTDQAGVAGAPGSATEFTQFNDLNSKPIEVIKAGKRLIKKRTGMEPNTLVLGREVFDVISEHPDVIGRFDRGQTSGPAIADEAVMGKLFGGTGAPLRVLVMNAVQNTAAEGVALAMDWIGGKSMFLCYSEPNPGPMKPTAGYTFASKSLTGTTELGTRITRMRLDPIRSERVEIDAIYGPSKVAADLGLFYATAVA